ncbi:MAG: Asp-tRNA(Asn)/Glu-tRNA(Gln) amidotransferase subunit GatB [Chloroflexi bacterium]|nr:Asp-tRNA(Asn)/Glu-tRNA(Gln) amidotransferase subunit GatB [Chloroflexota bacterium]
MTDYEIVIGLEVHAQVLTRSKMFCRCAAEYASAPPNTLVCPICLGLPGVLPTINRAAVEKTIMTGLALNCAIAQFSRFDRKNYHYPDLMKGYQVSQYALPLCREGWLAFDAPDGTARRVGIRRVHLEEDTAKLYHRRGPDGQAVSLVDVNRSGVPLMEIVSEPEIQSAEEAGRYLAKLRAILRYLGVSTGNMEEGAFRCDANVSVRRRGERELGVKVEVKNMNSFRAVVLALEFEAERQVAALERGERIEQETRGWVETGSITVSQRTKEYAHDYRYFPEPDLPPLVVTPAWLEELRARIPELPDAKRVRLAREHGLPADVAAQLAESLSTADLFEQAVARGAPVRAAANWITGEVFRLGRSGPGVVDVGQVTAERLAELLSMVEKGTISPASAKDVLAEVYRTGAEPAALVKQRGLRQVSDTAELERIIDEVIQQNPKAVADVQAGKQQAIGALLGGVMRATGGKANAQLATRLLRERLGL